MIGIVKKKKIFRRKKMIILSLVIVQHCVYNGNQK
jgi:hypothetical protein